MVHGGALDPREFICALGACDADVVRERHRRRGEGGKGCGNPPGPRRAWRDLCRADGGRRRLATGGGICGGRAPGGAEGVRACRVPVRHRAAGRLCRHEPPAAPCRLAGGRVARARHVVGALGDVDLPARGAGPCAPGRRLRLGRLASRPSGEGVRRRCRAAVDGDVRRGPEGEEACRRACGAVGVHAAEPPRGRALPAREPALGRRAHRLLALPRRRAALHAGPGARRVQRAGPARMRRAPAGGGGVPRGRPHVAFA